MRAFEITLRTPLRASADEVWAHARSLQGVNLELAPWIRMRPPRAAQGLALSDLGPDRPPLPFLLLLFGLIPIDRHALQIARVLPRGFDEESTTLLQRRWHHARRIEPSEAGCVLTDHLKVEPRLLPAFLVKPLVARIFASRHRRLRRRFGG